MGRSEARPGLKKKLTRFLERNRCAHSVTVNRWSLRAIVPAAVSLVAKKLIFLFVFLRAPSWSLLTRAMIRCELADSREYKAAVS